MEKIKPYSAKLTREEMKKISGGVAAPPAGWVCFTYTAIGAYTTWIQADTAGQANTQCHSNCVSNPACVFACSGPSCD